MLRFSLLIFLPRSSSFPSFPCVSLCFRHCVAPTGSSHRWAKRPKVEPSFTSISFFFLRFLLLQVIFKSFKLAPVMIGSALLLRKRYSGLTSSRIVYFVIFAGGGQAVILVPCFCRSRWCCVSQCAPGEQPFSGAALS